MQCAFGGLNNTAALMQYVVGTQYGNFRNFPLPENFYVKLTYSENVNLTKFFQKTMGEKLSNYYTVRSYVLLQDLLLFSPI